ncbi:MAG: MerR family transcriptional regulator [Aeromicrobium sp.]
MAMSPGSDDSPEIGWGVGSVAARLGIAASTLRTWERRYDVGPSRRTAGGHRRYTEIDIDRVILTQLLIARGAPARDAAHVAHSLDAAGLALALGAEQDRAPREDLEVDEVAPTVLRAAMDGDSRRISRLIADALDDHGAAAAWTDVIAPALIEIGHEWSVGRLPIEVEHLASEVIIGELRAYTRRAGDLGHGAPTIVLASAEEDLHSLPVFAMEAALAEAGLGSLVLGAQLPARSLASVARRLRPRVVFLWASLPRPENEPLDGVVAAAGSETTLVLAGPGWPDGIGQRTDLLATVERVRSLVQ